MKILISATEPSAELLAVELVVALKRLKPELEFEGLGGPTMAAAGVRLLAPPPVAVMGLGELFRHLGQVRANARVLREAMERRPAMFLCVDAPDFHLPLAKAARARGIRTVGVVAPQVWAWRPGRAKTLKYSLDQLLCLFSFEPELFTPYGLPAHWIGHPIVDRQVTRQPEPGTLALFPGSRNAEISRLLPDFLEAARIYGARRILLAQSPGRDLSRYADHPTIEVCSSSEAIIRAERALSKSGTVTLELAQAGIPTVVAHRVHPLTWYLGRLLVRGIQHIALPNILLKREVFAEYIQTFIPQTLAEALVRARPAPSQELTRLIGEPGVASRAAEKILSSS